MRSKKEIPDHHQWANDLKIGDTVFVQSQYGLSKEIVTKLTPTQIGLGSHDNRFKRHDLTRRIDAWSWEHIIRANPENTTIYTRQQQITKIFSLAHEIYSSQIKRSAIEKLTNDEVSKLHDLLKKSTEDIKVIVGGGE